MREILFRAKRFYNGEWVYGNFVIDKNDKPHIVPKDYFYEDGHHLQYYDDTDKPVFIDPETVGQFTGLTDKNGTKIFEGDIVRHYNHPDELERYSIGKIFWDEKHCTFRRTSKAWSAIVNIADTCVYEVIGNIHDNPELIGGGDDE